jgi:hypothetical protein
MTLPLQVLHKYENFNNNIIVYCPLHTITFVRTQTFRSFAEYASENWEDDCVQK